MENESQMSRGMSRDPTPGGDNECGAWEEVPGKTMAGTSPQSRGSTPLSTSLYLTPSAEMGGDSVEREGTKIRSPMASSMPAGGRSGGKSQVKESGGD